MPCPSCGSYNTIKNGKSASGVQRYKCKQCGKSYTNNASVSFRSAKSNQMSSTQQQQTVPTEQVITRMVVYALLFIIGLAVYWIFGIGAISVGLMVFGGGMFAFSTLYLLSSRNAKESKKHDNPLKGTIFDGEEDTSNVDEPNKVRDASNQYKSMYLPDTYHGKNRSYIFDTVDVCVIRDNQPDYGSLNIGDTVEFKGEPDNPYDSKAVAIYVDTVKIGYLYRGKIQDIANEYLASEVSKAIIGVITSVDKPKITIDIGLYK